MFNIGPGELLAICVVALLVLGPQRLPQALRSVGRAMGELRRLSGGFQDEFRRAIDDSELAEIEAEAQRATPAVKAAPAATTPPAEPATSTPVDRVDPVEQVDPVEDDEPARIEMPPPDGDGNGSNGAPVPKDEVGPADQPNDAEPGPAGETDDTSDSRTA